MIQKNKKTNLVDELIELIFGPNAISDKQKVNEINDYLNQLYDELTKLISEDTIPEENSKELNREFVGAIESDEQDGFIPFAVVKKERHITNFVCPNCNTQNNLFLSQFKKNQYNEYECQDCHKKYLLKLDFIPQIKVYIEQ